MATIYSRRQSYLPSTSSPLAPSLPPSSDDDFSQPLSSPLRNLFHRTTIAQPTSTERRSHKPNRSSRASSSSDPAGDTPTERLHNRSIQAALLAKRSPARTLNLDESNPTNPFSNNGQGFTNGGWVEGEWEEYTEYEELVIRKRAADMMRRNKGEWEKRWEDYHALVGDIDVNENIIENEDEAEEDIPSEFLEDENDALAAEAEYLLLQSSGQTVTPHQYDHHCERNSKHWGTSSRRLEPGDQVNHAHSSQEMSFDSFSEQTELEDDYFNDLNDSTLLQSFGQEGNLDGEVVDDSAMSLEAASIPIADEDHDMPMDLA